MDSIATLALRLQHGMHALRQRGPLQMDVAAGQQLAAAANTLDLLLKELPDDIRQSLHTADSGFASSGSWVKDAIQQQDKQVQQLERATRVLASWLGPNGLEAEEVFLIRGHIRGWAHRWRSEELGTAQADNDPEFVNFAIECLQTAGVTGDSARLIRTALSKNWRTEPWQDNQAV